MVGKKQVPDYDPGDIHWFPRIWDSDNQQGHVDYYKSYLGIDGTEPPSPMDNVKWLMGYQFNWMYWRYFMWNFAGRQNDFKAPATPGTGTGFRGSDRSTIGGWATKVNCRIP